VILYWYNNVKGGLQLTCPERNPSSVTLYITDHRWTTLGVNPHLRSDRPVSIPNGKLILGLFIDTIAFDPWEVRVTVEAVETAWRPRTQLAVGETVTEDRQPSRLFALQRGVLVLRWQ
jgi:hypothetical protein